MRAGQGVRFAIANEDSKVKAWFKLILKTATAATVSTVNLVDSTDINSISAQILS